MEITSYEVDEGAYGVAVAGDGAVWCSLTGSGALVRRDPDGTLSRLHLGAESRPTVLTTGPDGTVWFARSDASIGHVERDGTVTTWPVGGAASPYGLCVTADGDVWYTAPAEDRVGRLRVGRQQHEIDLPTGSMPSLLTVGPGPAVWLTLNQAHAVGAVVGDGVELVATPTAAAAPVGIAGTDRAVWFTEIGAGQVARLGRDGVVEEHPLPDRASRPHAVAATDDGGCWVTLWTASAAVRVDRRGRVVADAAFAEGAEPHGIAVAPDGSAWVALEAGALARIGRTATV